MHLANNLSFYYVPGSGPQWQLPDSSSFLMHPQIWLGTQTLEPGAMGSKLTPPVHACVTLDTLFLLCAWVLSSPERGCWCHLWWDKDAVCKKQLSCARLWVWCLACRELLSLLWRCRTKGLHVNLILPAGTSRPPVPLLLLYSLAPLSPQLSSVPPTNP